jgi:hypothetical protein
MDSCRLLFWVCLWNAINGNNINEVAMNEPAPTYRANPLAGVMTMEQQEQLARELNKGKEHGFSRVSIIIKNGFIRFILIELSHDAVQPERVENENRSTT